MDVSTSDSYADENSNNFDEAPKSRYYHSYFNKPITSKQHEVFICNHCNKKYSSKGSLNWHMKIHSNEFLNCKLCDYKTPYKATFQDHMASVHKTTRDVKCDHCLKKFKNDRSMRKHIRQFHPND
ncbi:zinc finger and BTB domain-containing protein 26-like [Aphidius gifuensis]|uniref:zinc finger and BTB domain-containing protein 26-like n=1 Tax=Aphidius gifuensis TaxID=684658 RepID=UPI001CDB86AF|nr:zinc finger and BTB domain-containing protein 26-like [Aphidius gifuensis]